MKRTAATVAFLALLLPFAVAAQPGMMGKGDCDGPMMGPGGHRGGERCEMGHCGMMKRGGKHGDMVGRLLRLADELKLSDSQRDKLRDMVTAFRLQRIDARAALKKAQVRLRALMRDDAPERQVMRAIDEVAGLRADLQKMRYRHRQQALGVLTDDQREKLKELREDRMKERCGMKGKMMGASRL